MKIKHICKQCNQTFLAYSSQKKLFCSPICSYKGKRGRCFVKERISKPCVICKARFLSKKTLNRKFCSRKCFNSQQITINKTCRTCKQSFSRTIRPSELTKQKWIFCSNSCRNKLHKPKTFFGKNAAHWTGGKHLSPQGYIAVYSPGHPKADRKIYVLEHRLVAEQHLGRFLKSSEIVHHINEIKTDNRPENLYLFESNSAHIKHHNNPKPLTSNLPKIQPC